MRSASNSRRDSRVRVAASVVGVVAIALSVLAVQRGVSSATTGGFSGGLSAARPVETSSRFAAAGKPQARMNPHANPKAITPIAVASTPAAASPAPESKPTPRPAGQYLVVIDAGHQGKGDSRQEPIGPGASETKPRVSSGTAGVSTRNAESLVNLQVALRLRDALQSRGVRVIMVRTSQNVNISNSERANIANDAGADLSIRLHCDGSTDPSRVGLATLVPGKNSWTGPIVSESGQAGRIIHRSVLDASGAKDRRVVSRTDLSGFNWSRVPSVLVEMGFMSNSAEDKRLATAAYQDKLASGIADGCVRYLESR